MGGKLNRSKNSPKQIMAWSALILIIGWLGFNWPKDARYVKTATGPSLRGTAATSATADSQGQKGNRAEIITELLNLRSEPNTNKKNIIGTLRKGLVIEVLDKKPGWLQVKLGDGRTGFVAYRAKYIRFLDQ